MSLFGETRPSREAVFKALFALTAGVQWNINPVEGDPPEYETFAKRQRRIRLFSDVPSEEQPWLGQAEHAETSQQVTGMPYKRIWAAQWMVYHQAGLQPNAEPTIRNNLIIDALEAALAPKPQDQGFFDERNTLMGLVYHCFIDGEVFKDPGDIDNQAMIVVPIKLLVP